MIVIQLSDPHILAPGELLYRQFDTCRIFGACGRRDQSRLDPLPDVAVITGDLVDHGEPPNTSICEPLLAPLAMPVFVIPGNHDARAPLRAAFTADGYLPADGFLQYAIPRTIRSGSSPSTPSSRARPAAYYAPERLALARSRARLQRRRDRSC